MPTTKTIQAMRITFTNISKDRPDEVLDNDRLYLVTLAGKNGTVLGEVMDVEPNCCISVRYGHFVAMSPWLPKPRGKYPTGRYFAPGVEHRFFTRDEAASWLVKQYRKAGRS